MTNHSEEFDANTVDEQLAQLLGEDEILTPSHSPIANQLLVSHLQQLYHGLGKADAASVERVFQQLQQNQDITQFQHPNNGKNAYQSHIQSTNQTGRTSSMQKTQFYTRNKRIIDTLVAVLVIGLLIGSLLTVIQISHHNPAHTDLTTTKTAIKQTPQSTPTLAPTSQPTTAPTSTPQPSPTPEPCANNPTLQNATPGTYIRASTTVFKLDNQTGQIDWQYSTGNETKNMIAPDPVVLGNTVYVSSVDDTLTAIDTNTGKKLWKQQWPLRVLQNNELPATRMNLRPVVSCGLLVILAADDNLHVLNTMTGQELWEKPMGNGASSMGPADPMVAQDGILYIAPPNDTSFYALRLQDASVVWQQPLVNKIGSVPYLKDLHVQILDGTVYVYGEDAQENGDTAYHHIQAAFTAKDGKLLWNTTPFTSNDNMLCLANITNSVALFTDYNFSPSIQSGQTASIYAYDLKKQMVLWHRDTVVPHHTASNQNDDLLDIVNNTIYVNTKLDGNEILQAIDVQTGNVLWSVPNAEPMNASASDNADVIYVSLSDTSSGSPAAFNNAGKKLWSYVEGSSTTKLIVSHGNAYQISYQSQNFYLSTVTYLNPSNGTKLWIQQLPISPVTPSQNGQQYFQWGGVAPALDLGFIMIS